MKEYYLKDNETITEAFARAATGFCFGDYKLAQRLYDAVYLGWFMFSSPILSNAPKIDKWPTKSFFWNKLWLKYKYKKTFSSKGMPISCFLTYVPDTIEGQFDAGEELCRLSVAGGGVGQHLKMRGVTSKSPGAIPYIKTSDSNILYYKQGETRKGAVATYLDVDHPDIIEYISIRKPTGGDPNRKAFNIHNAVNITYDFLNAVRFDAKWQLICPKTKKVIDVVNARELWEAILDTRYKTGEPYINNLDEANYRMPNELKTLGLKIHGSNLCNEIHLPTDEQRTAVCCLSSLNLTYFDVWKDKGLVSDLTVFLDNVIEFFIRMAPDSLKKAKYSAYRSRDIGIGTMGWHQYLQRKGIPFESGGNNSAVQYTNIIYKHITKEAFKESYNLAKQRGTCPDSSIVRNMHRIAIAPNANSSILCGCSPSIEPWKANIYIHRTRLGTTLVKNPMLANLLFIHSTYAIPEDDYESRKLWVEKQWDRILKDEGSVQNLSWMSVKEKEVYKTAKEIDQMWVVIQGRHRQQYIDQGQSVNLDFPAGASKEEVNKVHWTAFDHTLDEGVPMKGLYYLRTTALRKGENVSSKIKKDKLKDFENEEEPSCLSCEG